MRIYQNCNEAITDIGRELKKCASTVHTQTYQNKIVKDDPDFATKELQAFEFCVLDTNDKDQMPAVTLDWANAEFAERIDPDFYNPGKAWELRKDVWEEFLVERFDMQKGMVKEFEYSYNERIQWQLQGVINELRIRPETRQAIIEVHSRNIDSHKMGRERVPCSMFYHFMKRDGALDVIYVMRSSDFSTHFQNDIWLADELRRHIAKHVGLPIGKFFMFVSSLHIYKKDWDMLSNY